MTRDNLLDDLEAKVAAATPGPWGIHQNRICVVGDDGKPAERTGMRTAGDPYPTIARMAADYAPDHRNAACIAALKNAAPELLRRAREKDKMVAAYDEALWLARCQRDQASVRGNRAEESRDALAEALREIIAQAKALGSDEFTLDQVADVARAALAKIDALSRTTSTTEEGKP